MRILNWVQNKFNGREEKKRSNEFSSSASHNPIKDVRNEEIDNWPRSLLSIGTFGNKDLNDAPHDESLEDRRASQDVLDFTLEEAKKLQEELAKLLRRRSKSSFRRSSSGEDERANLPLDRFLNCPSSLEVNRTVGNKNTDNSDYNEINGDLSPNTKIILCKARDLLASKRDAIKQRSLTFLLKKMFVCRGGFAPAPSFKDPLMESKTEKILRTIIHKKMFSQSASPSTTTKRCLENKPTERTRKCDREEEERGEGGCKWVKTDADYIVLEM
ncbi:uncharacterized protein LOC109708553 isoform X1 [Ananas comosus]|uniref:Uncharacterized protein LOC109708553 isoform X1 n=1 Tax=Ananas comosus TaxID=4615 RepID=A0A6P5EXL2_ANACO|nr:uncharacterized protein LOC109708553 isoform X1 [Ananas comosus]XP_020085944.1 uncharacterized protein LOC109708553 isoform X1 [Ananas comosus]